MLRTAAALAGAVSLAACTTAPATQNDVVGTANLQLASGGSAGTATLLRDGSELLMDLNVRGVPGGLHGIHLHMTGQCTPPDFQSAGGHLNPFNRQHGLADPDGPHMGDLPNLEVEPSGTTTIRMEITDTADQVLPYIFDADGTALVIHAKPDDNVTDPSGNSGDRLVCGVFQRS